jgi:hypothetical protein
MGLIKPPATPVVMTSSEGCGKFSIKKQLRKCMQLFIMQGNLSFFIRACTAERRCAVIVVNMGR